MISGYKEHPVDTRLAPYVACYWTHNVAGDFRGSHPVMPDGCIDLLFESGAQTLNVVGTMTRTLWAENCGPTQFAGVRFKAGGAIPFIRDRADLLTDDIAGADDVFGRAGRDLKQGLLDGGSIDERVRILEQFLVGQLRCDVAPVDPRIAWATTKLADSPDNRIELLAGELGLSRQYLRRLFLQHTGLSPKAFARVARLGKLVKALQANIQLAEASLDSGYSDQAHMNHEFKAMAGITPVAYRSLR